MKTRFVNPLIFLSLAISLIACGVIKKQHNDTIHHSTEEVWPPDTPVAYLGPSQIVNQLWLGFRFSNPPKSVTVNGMPARISRDSAYWDWKQQTDRLDLNMVIGVVWEDWAGEKKKRVFKYREYEQNFDIEEIRTCRLYDGPFMCLTFNTPLKTVTVNGATAKVLGKMAFCDWKEVAENRSPDTLLDIVWEDWAGRTIRRIITYREFREN